MFQNLHCFEDKEFFDEHPYIYIYTPEGTLVYEVVSAGVTDNKHILYTYDYFEDEDVFEKYLENMQKVSNMGTYVREEVELSTDSRILIMSTCVGNNEKARYIVQAVKIYDDREEE
jgi:sortase B